MAFNKEASSHLAADQLEKLRKTYLALRHVILLFVALTIADAVCLLTNSDINLILAAFLPHFFINVGMMVDGISPENLPPLSAFSEEPVFFAFCAIATILVILALLFWFFSKSHSGWLMATATFVLADTIFMLIMFPLSVIFIGLIVHVITLACLVIAVAVRLKYKKLLKADQAQIDE